MAFLCQDLPGQQAPHVDAPAGGLPANCLAASTNAAFVTMTNAIMRTSDAQLTRQTESAQSATPSGKLKDLLPSLMFACQVQSAEDLPTFWHVMAWTPKQ
jgi:hypothetical protein